MTVIFKDPVVSRLDTQKHQVPVVTSDHIVSSRRGTAFGTKFILVEVWDLFEGTELNVSHSVRCVGTPTSPSGHPRTLEPPEVHGRDTEL